ncbi:hypothetical protein TM1040_0986 [Ruegeria sp. TM1040]|nr:hypothetical protein TM1040_0986 [Ruegeria sp. TM1040]
MAEPSAFVRDNLATRAFGGIAPLLFADRAKRVSLRVLQADRRSGYTNEASAFHRTIFNTLVEPCERPHCWISDPSPNGIGAKQSRSKTLNKDWDCASFCAIAMTA